MPLGFKTTIAVSLTIAGLLNIFQLETSYAEQAQAAKLAVAASPSTVASSVPARPIPQPSPPAATSTPSPTPTPAVLAPVMAVQARLSAAGLNAAFAGSYLAVQHQTGTPWQLLAAVHKTETGQSGDTARRSSAGATGPLQFMPTTFAHYALDGDANGTKDITSYNDAIFTAGRYLAAGGADKGRYTTALYNYNHSNTYVNHVMTIARRLGL